MIHLFTWPTPNGIKPQIMLEETGLPYKVTGIDITRGDQFKPAFLRISPNNKMPAIIDEKGPGGSPCRFSNRARSSCIWRRRPAS